MNSVNNKTNTSQTQVVSGNSQNSRIERNFHTGYTETEYTIQQNLDDHRMYDNESCREKLEELQKAANKKKLEINPTSVQKDWADEGNNLVSLKDLWIEENNGVSQRDALSPTRVPALIQMITGFNVKAIGAIAVATDPVTGKLYCADGGGRSTVLTMLGFDSAPCVMIKANSQERMELFQDQSKNKKALGNLVGITRSVQKKQKGERLSNEDKKNINSVEILDKLTSNKGWNHGKLKYYKCPEERSISAFNNWRDFNYKIGNSTIPNGHTVEEFLIKSFDIYFQVEHLIEQKTKKQNLDVSVSAFVNIALAFFYLCHKLFSAQDKKPTLNDVAFFMKETIADHLQNSSNKIEDMDKLLFDFTGFKASGSDSNVSARVPKIIEKYAEYVAKPTVRQKASNAKVSMNKLFKTNYEGLMRKFVSETKTCLNNNSDRYPVMA